jgi:hypothetical protein
MIMARQELTEQALLNNLNQQLSAHDTCSDCRFTSIGRIRDTDESGCNWSQANLQCSGQPVAVCRQAADHVISTARAIFNLK